MVIEKLRPQQLIEGAALVVVDVDCPAPTYALQHGDRVADVWKGAQSRALEQWLIERR